jgi:putative FmdB family regulatory protein
MPIFSYRCQSCAHQFDELVRGTEKVSCPKCHSAKLTKLFAPFAVAMGAAADGCAHGKCDLGGCDAGQCPSGGCPSGGCGMDA